MTELLTVRYDPARTTSVPGVIASLPVSLGRGGYRADLHAVDGSRGWTSRAVEAIDAGARGIVVVSPEPENTDRLEQHATNSATRVVIDYPLASNPVLHAAVPAFQAQLSSAGLVEITAHLPEASILGQTKTELLVLAGRLLGSLEKIRLLRTSSTGFGIAATLPQSGAPVTLTTVVSPALERTVSVRLLNQTGALSLEIPDPATARPAFLTATTEEGRNTVPTIFESAHRASWKRLLDLVKGEANCSDLAEFQAAASLHEPGHLSR